MTATLVNVLAVGGGSTTVEDHLVLETMLTNCRPTYLPPQPNVQDQASSLLCRYLFNLGHN